MAKARLGLPLTIKLAEKVQNLLGNGATTLLVLNDTLLDGLAEVDLENQVQGEGDDRQDDGEAAKTPTPVLDVEQEGLSSLGSGKGSDHVGGRGEGKSQTSIAEVGGISSQNTDSVDHASEANRVKDLGSAEGGQVVRGSSEDEADGGKGDHEEETLSATPDVEHLGHGDVDGRGHGISDNGDNSQEGVRSPFAGGIGQHDSEDGNAEALDEEEEPDTGSKVSMVFLMFPMWLREAYRQSRAAREPLPQTKVMAWMSWTPWEAF